MHVKRVRNNDQALNKQRYLQTPEDIVGWLLNVQHHAGVSQGWICSIICAATLRKKLQIKLAISPSHSVMAQGQPVPALSL